MPKEELEKSIDKIPLFEEREVYVNGVLQPHLKAIVEQGNSLAIAVLSKEYQLYQIRDSFREVLKHFDEDVQGEVYYYDGRALMKIFPKDSEVGLVVQNSVDGSAALSANFIARKGLVDIWLPADGYWKMHVGNIRTEFKRVVKEIAKMKDYWETIVRRLSERPISEEDLAVLEEIYSPSDPLKIPENERKKITERKAKAAELKLGKKLAKRLAQWVREQQGKGVVVNTWSFILRAMNETIKEYTELITRKMLKGKDPRPTEMGLQEKLRQLSIALLNYALA